MSFYFAEIKNITEDSITLSGAEHKHLVQVMRAKKGDTVSVTDGAGMVYECFITKRGREKTELSIIKGRRNVGEPTRSVTLAVGLSTGSKFDLILQMCTEIGVSCFAPLLTQKSKIKLSDLDRIERKLRRWRETIKASVKQTMRSRLPEISSPQEFGQYVRGLSEQKMERVIAHPAAGAVESRAAYQALIGSEEPLIILLGPESGFSPEEFNLAFESSFVPLNLGERILRAETAAPALAALALLGKN